MWNGHMALVHEVHDGSSFGDELSAVLKQAVVPYDCKRKRGRPSHRQELAPGGTTNGAVHRDLSGAPGAAPSWLTVFRANRGMWSRRRGWTPGRKFNGPPKHRWVLLWTSHQWLLLSKATGEKSLESTLPKGRRNYETERKSEV